MKLKKNFYFTEPKALVSSKEAYGEKTDSIRIFFKKLLTEKW